MSTIGLENPPEMEKLLKKYNGGNIPPLITDGENEGLFGEDGEEILEIHRLGLSARYSIPLYIFPVPQALESPRTRGSEASAPRDDYLNLVYGSDQEDRLSYEDLYALLRSCKRLQFPRESDAVSKSGVCGCCLAKPMLAMQNGRPIAYMCYAGMIGFVVPVSISGKIIAILSTECKKPGEGAIWSEGVVEQDGCRLPIFGSGDQIKLASDLHIPSSTAKVDIWEESKRRIQECERILGLEPDELLKRITENAKMDPSMEISPDELETIMISRLEKAGRYLSDLANKTYRLEKDSVIGWIRAEMASALSSIDTFWDKIRWCLGNLARLLGVDYILLISHDRSNVGSLELQCHYGLPQESLPALQYNWLDSTNQVSDFTEKMNVAEHIQEIDLRQYRDVPILSELYSLYGKGTNYSVLVAPAATLGDGLIFIVLGKRNPVVMQKVFRQRAVPASVRLSAIEWLRDDDRQYLIDVVRELAIITSVFFSIKRMQETKEEQTNFMESVAHDLRTPIQNIMVATENLREGRVSPERASRTIAGVLTQIQRLNLLAQKAWMLEQIRLDSLVYNDEQTANPYSIMAECRDLMADMAARRSIEIHIDPELKSWRSICLDTEKFRLVAMNLIHNGIKYSFPHTYIRIGGWQDAMGIGVAITFENEGIPIHDEEKDRIFDRYFRSKDALKMDPSGSGIGLALVKEFVDHYKGKIDVRSTEIGFGRYLNVFSLYLPGR